MNQTAPTGTRKYAGEHKNLRAQLLADLKRRPGQPCTRCGWPMYPWQRLHLDHSDDGTRWLGLAHARCNQQAGQRQTTAILRAREQWQAASWRTWPSSRRWLAVRRRRRPQVRTGAQPSQPGRAVL